MIGAGKFKGYSSSRCVSPLVLLLLLFLLLACTAAVGSTAPTGDAAFPLPLSSYDSGKDQSLTATLLQRIERDPFNLVATVIFFLAIVHTFAAPYFLRLSHRFEAEHRRACEQLRRESGNTTAPEQVSFKAEIFHFLGEIEAVFGIWIVPLLVAITLTKGWHTARNYLAVGLNFTEPLFVVVIMAMAASRPILLLSERLLSVVAGIGRGSAAAWWFSILTFGPLLGSFITEPAAMTISALLLGRKFYPLNPRPAFAYATLGCLFVNVSVGGTLTHFAAPPVLMVAGRWGWGLEHMLQYFGWKAAAGIVLSNVLYFLLFRREFAQMRGAGPDPEAPAGQADVPLWITVVHICFLAWTVWNNHYPVMFIGAFLFYLAFVQATEHHQSEVRLRPALLVGFFLAGLVVHGGLQGWWIQPMLTRLNEVPLFLGAGALTAFNDNAAITYLASLVPDFGDNLKHAVVAGAVVGGGLTVIANAPNPAGQSILSRFFPDGVSPLRLLVGALVPTIIVGLVFLLFRP